MKCIQDIERMTMVDWDRIGADVSLPVPKDLQVRLPRRRAVVWSIAASVAVVAGIGLSALLRTPEPKDTFTDPYLAYAAVEQAFSRMGQTVARSADIIEQSENKVTYWK